MEEIFYAVRVIMNGRAGTQPSTFASKEDALAFANDLARLLKDPDVKTEIHIYEIKEINY